MFWNTTRGKVDIYNLQLSRGSSVTSVNTWDFRSPGLTQSVTTRKNFTTQRLNRSAFVVVAAHFYNHVVWQDNSYESFNESGSERSGEDHSENINVDVVSQVDCPEPT